MDIFAKRNKAIKQTVSPSNLNKKIEKRLDITAEIFADAVGNRHRETISRGMFYKRVCFQDLHFIQFLDLKYTHENRLFSISYNLELSSEVSGGEMTMGMEDCSFAVQNKGTIHTKDAKWICKAFRGETEAQEHILKNLNNRFIIDRIVALDLFDVSLHYKKDRNIWTIRCGSMIGSTTWILIPPVTNLIKPRTEECIQFVEFFQLVADAAINNQK